MRYLIYLVYYNLLEKMTAVKLSFTAIRPPQLTEAGLSVHTAAARATRLQLRVAPFSALSHSLSLTEARPGCERGQHSAPARTGRAI